MTACRITASFKVRYYLVPNDVRLNITIGKSWMIFLARYVMIIDVCLWLWKASIVWMATSQNYQSLSR